MQRLLELITKRRIIIALIVLAIVVSAWLIIFHGFIRVEGVKAGKSVYYSQFDSNLRSAGRQETGTMSFLSSGEYSFQIPMQNGGVYTQSETIPLFLGTKTVRTPNYESALTPLGRRVARNIVISKSGLVSWSTNSGVYKIDSSDTDSDINSQTPLKLSGFDSLTNYQNLNQISKSKVVGLDRVDKNKYTPVVYDFMTGKLFSYTSIAGDSLLQAESGGFSIYNKTTSSVSYYPQGSATITQKQVGEDKRVALYDGKPMYSFVGGSTNRLIVATGPHLYSDGDTDHSKNNNDERSVKLLMFNTATDKKLVERSINNALLTHLSVSMDGKYVAVVTTESITIYNADSLSRVITVPYTTSDRLFWLSNGDVVLNANEYGLMKISPSEKSAHSLAPYSLIRPTQLSYIDGDKLYFTGFSSLNELNRNPDAYQLSISKSASSVERKIFRAFPHQGEGFYVDRLDGVTTVQLTRYISSRGVLVSESVKQDALDYVKSVTGSNEKINFTYITTDLRTRDTGEE